MDSRVYFLRPVGMDGPVKIGCSVNPEGRLGSYNAIAPWPLELAASLPGDYRLEARFHAKFVAQHSHHEWFHPCPELTETIEAVRAATFELETLPPNCPSPCRKGRRPMSSLSRQSMSARQRLNWRERQTGIATPEHITMAFWGRYSSNATPVEEAIRLAEEYLATPPPEEKAA